MTNTPTYAERAAALTRRHLGLDHFDTGGENEPIADINAAAYRELLEDCRVVVSGVVGRAVRLDLPHAEVTKVLAALDAELAGQKKQDDEG